MFLQIFYSLLLALNHSPLFIHIFFFSLGIYSDTHVLNLMYTGEMCYWYLENIKQHGRSNSEDSVSLATKGKAALQTYIRLTEGPLKSCGWSTDRAKQLLNTPYFS